MICAQFIFAQIRYAQSHAQSSVRDRFRDRCKRKYLPSALSHSQQQKGGVSSSTQSSRLSAACGNMPEKIIIVTGFGPFAGHEERNASWEAVKLLPDVFHFRKDAYQLRKYQVPVIYEEVNRILPQIWNQKPDVSLTFLALLFVRNDR